MSKLSLPLKWLSIVGLLFMAVWANYFASDLITTLFYLVTLVVYFQSKDEPFWLVFFLVVSDGFMGFFNNYEAVLTAIPGLPPVEVGHFYIILAFVKSFRIKREWKPFYNGFLAILLIYLIFLIVQGYTIGLSPELNVQFRVLKFVLPLTMLYSLPILMQEEKDYQETLGLIMPFAFTTLLAQVITITMGFTPAQIMGVTQDAWFAVDVNKGHTYRGFYSTKIVLFSFFGAMYYLANRVDRFSPTLLYAVLAADFLAAFLSATRGWVLCLGLTLFLFLVFVLRLSVKRMATITMVAVISLVGLMAVPVINKQFSNAFERLLTLEALAKGDVTAGGTLERLDERSPRVMNKWAESPLTGWGFSDEFFQFADFHVGNQNILMHSGIIGAFLMVAFLVYFHFQLFQRSWVLTEKHPLKYGLLVFPIFFAGWFIVHSTSGQQFHYYDDPDGAIPLALFLSMGGWVYRSTLKKDETTATGEA
jgi:hypothetical protein